MTVVFYTGEGTLCDRVREKVLTLFPTATSISPQHAPATIEKADLVLVHLVGPEPFALYLLGAAAALSRTVVMLAPHQEVIPAFLADKPAIIHAWNFDHLAAELARLQGGALKPSAETPAEKFHKIFGDLLKEHGYQHRGAIEREGTVFTLRDQEMDLALVQKIANRARSLNLRVRLM